jgi:hypothetical protein
MLPCDRLGWIELLDNSSAKLFEESLLKKALIFGPDAQRMFAPRKSSKKVRVASKRSLSF